MIARLTSFSGDPGRLREGARLYEEQILPWLRDATGFRGVMILHDGVERALGLTFWETEEDAVAAEQALVRFRKDISAAIGSTQLSAESYEVVLSLGPSSALES